MRAVAAHPHNTLRSAPAILLLAASLAACGGSDVDTVLDVPADAYELVTAPQLPGTPLAASVGADGEILVAYRIAGDELFLLSAGGDGRTISGAPGLPTTMATATDGVLWMASEGGGVWTVDGETVAKRTPAGGGALAVSPDGTLWAVNSRGDLTHFAGRATTYGASRAVRDALAGHGEPFTPPLVVGADGTVWVGLPGIGTPGLASFDPAATRWAIVEDPVLTGHTGGLAASEDGAVWVSSAPRRGSGRPDGDAERCRGPVHRIEADGAESWTCDGSVARYDATGWTVVVPDADLRGAAIAPLASGAVAMLDGNVLSLYDDGKITVYSLPWTVLDVIVSTGDGRHLVLAAPEGLAIVDGERLLHPGGGE